MPENNVVTVHFIHNDIEQLPIFHKKVCSHTLLSRESDTTTDKKCLQTETTD